MAALDADVVALQEIGWHHRGLKHFDQFAFLGRETGYHLIEAPTKFHARAHYGNALLLRERAQEHRRLDLSAPFEVPRGCVIARLDFDGAPLTVFNAHLGLTPWERRRQARRLAHEFDRTEGEIVLVGDFNSWHHGCAMSRVFAERLPHVTDEATFHARAPRLPLDRIYLSAGLAFESVEAVRTGPAACASDHLPLRARIRRR